MASLAALTMLAACQKDVLRENTPNRPSNDVIDDTTPVAITLNANAPAIETKVATRAMGTVGGTTDANAWAGETLYIYGFETGATGGYAKALINGLPVPAPDPGATSLDEFKYPEGSLLDPEKTESATNPSIAGEPYLYQNDLVYEFYGYHIDDAYATKSSYDKATKVDPVLSNDAVMIPFLIDGGQDLMIAHTDKEADLGSTPNVPLNKLYSAYSARRSVVPNLQFNHVLSRFTFDVVPGSPNARLLKINSVKVKSPAKGDLDILKGDVNHTATREDVTVDGKAIGKMYKEADVTAFELRKLSGTGATRTLVALDPATDPNLRFEYVDEENFDKSIYAPKPIGESIMVIPGAEAYYLEVELGWNNDYNQKINPIKAYINIADVVPTAGLTKGATFEPGKSYNITIVVYGPELISLKASLTPWVDAGSQLVDQDKDQTGYLDITPNDVTAGLKTDYKAFSKTYKVYTDAASTWTATLSGDNAALFSVTPASGTGNGTVTVSSVGVNNTDAALKASLDIKVGATTKSIAIEQGVKGSDITFGLAEEEVVFGADVDDTDGETKVVIVNVPKGKTIAGSTDFIVSAGSPAWFEATLDDMKETITLKVSADNASTEKTGTVTVKCDANGDSDFDDDGETLELTVKQLAPVTKPTITFADSKVSYDLPDGASETFVTTNVYTLSAGTEKLEVKTEADWLKFSVNKTAKTIKLTALTCNPSASDTRSADVYVTPEGGDAVKLTITQPAFTTPTLAIATATATFSDAAAGKTAEVTYTISGGVTDNPVVVKGLPAWLSYSVNTTDKKITFTANEANLRGDDREVVVQAVAKDGNSVDVTVTQPAGTAVIKAEAAAFADKDATSLEIPVEVNFGTSSTDLTATLTTNPDSWLKSATISGDDATGYTLKVEATAANSGDAQAGVVTIASTTKSVSITVDVTRVAGNI